MLFFYHDKSEPLIHLCFFHFFELGALGALSPNRLPIKQLCEVPPSNVVQSAAGFLHPHTSLRLAYAGYLDTLAALVQECTSACSACNDIFVNLHLFFPLDFGGLLLGNVDIYSWLYFSPFFYSLSRTGRQNFYLFLSL